MRAADSSRPGTSGRTGAPRAEASPSTQRTRVGPYDSSPYPQIIAVTNAGRTAWPARSVVTISRTILRSMLGGSESTRARTAGLSFSESLHGGEFHRNRRCGSGLAASTSAKEVGTSGISGCIYASPPFSNARTRQGPVRWRKRRLTVHRHRDFRLSSWAAMTFAHGRSLARAYAVSENPVVGSRRPPVALSTRGVAICQQPASQQHVRRAAGLLPAIFGGAPSAFDTV
jgi:hypothetical protein